MFPGSMGLSAMEVDMGNTPRFGWQAVVGTNVPQCGVAYQSTRHDLTVDGEYRGEMNCKYVGTVKYITETYGVTKAQAKRWVADFKASNPCPKAQ